MPKKVDDTDSNAYSSLKEEGAVQSSDAEALSSLIKQHSANLRGDEDLDLTDDVPMTSPIAQDPPQAAVPSAQNSKRGLVGIMRSKSKYSRRKQQQQPVAGTGNVGTTKSISFSDGTKTAHTSHIAKSATRIRAMICLSCLVFSLILALLFGHGSTGLIITSNAINSADSASVSKEPPVVTGMPGPFGTPSVYNSSFDIPDLEAMNILLSPQIENLADWKIPFPASNRTDMPLFWHVPKSGGTVVQRILGLCLGLVEASSQGATHDEPVSCSLEELSPKAPTSHLTLVFILTTGPPSIRNIRWYPLYQCRPDHRRRYPTRQGLPIG